MVNNIKDYQKDRYYIVKMTNEEYKSGVLIEDNDIISFNPNQVVALYENNEGENINIGYPTLAPYSPMMGNMYGYEKAFNKGYFLKCDEEILNRFIYHSTYAIEISSNLTINTIIGMNELGNSDFLFDEQQKSVKKLKKVVNI